MYRTFSLQSVMSRKSVTVVAEISEEVCREWFISCRSETSALSIRLAMPFFTGLMPFGFPEAYPGTEDVVDCCDWGSLPESKRPVMGPSTIIQSSSSIS